MENEVRKLPKKTVIIIAIMAIIGLLIFLGTQNLKEQKISEIIATLGHDNIKDMQVINKLSVEDKETRYKSKVYKVRFFDLTQNKTCVGFVHMGRNKEYSKDFDCK